MSKKITLSTQTRANWLIDAGVFVSGLLAALTGIYFLFVPVGGYQGGRNPLYGVTILFDRHTWEDLHTWTGVAMIAAAAIHFAIHGPWIKTMARRIVNAMLSRGSSLSAGARLNVAVDVVVAISFAITAVSGLYFFFVSARTPLIVSSVVWDVLHTWAGVVMISAIVVHFWIHWRWVTQVTSRFFLSLPMTGNRRQPAEEPVQSASMGGLRSA